MKQSRTEEDQEAKQKFDNWEKKFNELNQDAWANLSLLAQLRDEISESVAALSKSKLAEDFVVFIGYFGRAGELTTKILNAIIYQCKLRM